MDALGALLTGPRARDAFVLRSIFDPPWAIRIEDEAPLTVLAVVRGTTCIRPDSGAPIHIRAGDVAVIRGPQPYTVADGEATAPQALIGPGQECLAPDGSGPSDMSALGVREWGNAASGETVLLTGSYQGHGEVNRRLLGALPQVIVLGERELDTPLVGLLAAEARRDDPGQDAVLDRLLDLLLITALRVWLSRTDEATPGWYRAQADPVVGPALSLMHADPAKQWTVASLARSTRASRSELARRFTDLVGEPPMSYLTDWRLALAADLLLEPEATIASVAPQVGYGSAFALSSAFKRVRGVSPKQHREIALAS